MVSFLIVSNIILWVCVIALVLVVLAMVRQVGVLYERVAPAGALMINQQVNVGEVAPAIAAKGLNKEKTLSIAGKRANGKSQLVFFVAPDCPVCKSLLPVFKSSAAAEKDWLEVVLASDGDDQLLLEYIKNQSLQDFDFANSEVLGKSYGVAKLPYAVLIDANGILKSMGLVNSREHLESLFEAKELGVASLQDYMKRKQSA